MKRRFILYRRKRGGMFYVEVTESRQAASEILSRKVSQRFSKLL